MSPGRGIMVSAVWALQCTLCCTSLITIWRNSDCLVRSAAESSSTAQSSTGKSRAWKKAWLFFHGAPLKYTVCCEKRGPCILTWNFFFFILDIWTVRFCWGWMTVEAEVQCECLQDACRPNEKQVLVKWSRPSVISLKESVDRLSRQSTFSFPQVSKASVVSLYHASVLILKRRYMMLWTVPLDLVSFRVMLLSFSSPKWNTRVWE